jgi:hypothetical protein
MDHQKMLLDQFGKVFEDGREDMELLHQLVAIHPQKRPPLDDGWSHCSASSLPATFALMALWYQLL